MIDALYDDPDEKDDYLKEKAKAYSDEYKLEFSPDGICGWKVLFDFYSGEKGDEKVWIKYYKIIRGSVFGELYWPIENSKTEKTINQQRGMWLGDRLDWTLLEIYRYYENGCPQKLSFNGNTATYLKKFENFNSFCDKLGIVDVFVNKEYKVIDLSTGSIINNAINMSWSNRWNDKKKEPMKKYLDRLIKILEKFPKS